MRGEVRMKKFLIVLLAAVFCISGALLIKSELEKKSARDFYRDMQESMENSLKEKEAAETEPVPDNTETDEPSYTPPEYLQELMVSNPYVIGWVVIDGTKVNLPIVQNKDDNEYFLHRNINGEENISGSIYLDSNHDINADGLHTVYGHRMKDGSMFKDVSRFIDASYMAEHQDITVYTGEKSIALEPVYCYADQADGEYRNIFGTTEDLEAFLLKKTGKEIEADNVFVFVTCEYSHQDGRVFLICRER